MQSSNKDGLEDLCAQIDRWGRTSFLFSEGLVFSGELPGLHMAILAVVRNKKYSAVKCSVKYYFKNECEGFIRFPNARNI